jgi:hypothetical protein
MGPLAERCRVIFTKMTNETPIKIFSLGLSKSLKLLLHLEFLPFSVFAKNSEILEAHLAH